MIISITVTYIKLSFALMTFYLLKHISWSVYYITERFVLNKFNREKGKKLCESIIVCKKVATICLINNSCNYTVISVAIYVITTD